MSLEFGRLNASWNRSHKMYLCEFKEPGLDFPEIDAFLQRKLDSVNFYSELKQTEFEFLD